MSDTLDQLLAEFAAKPTDKALARAARRLVEDIGRLGKVAGLPAYAGAIAGQAADIAAALEAR